MPETIDIETSPFDKDLINYLVLKRAYYLKKYPLRQAVLLMKQCYNDLPCVRSVKISEYSPDVLEVTWNDNSIDNERIPPLIGRSISWTKEIVEETLQFNFNNWKKNLMEGDVIILYSSGGKIHGGSGMTSDLIIMLPILRSGNTLQQKLDLIRQHKITFGNDDYLNLFAKNFSASYQLDERLQKISKAVPEK